MLNEPHDSRDGLHASGDWPLHQVMDLSHQMMDL